MLSGGGDLDPAGYGAAPHPETDPGAAGTGPGRARPAGRRAGRGPAGAGHLPRPADPQRVPGRHAAAAPAATAGHSAAPGTFGRHPVRVAPGSRLASVLGPPDAGGALWLDVPTAHHQAIGRLGDGLVATAWAADGTIEAVEATNRDDPFLIAVQWHPEAGHGSAIVPCADRCRAAPGARERKARARRASRLACVSDGPAVEIHQLAKSYGRTMAVNGLSLLARRAAVTAILGPNGAGKTTTIEICEGYRRPDGGTVRVLGLDPVAERAAAAAADRRHAAVRRHPARRPGQRVPAHAGRVLHGPDRPRAAAGPARPGGQPAHPVPPAVRRPAAAAVAGRRADRAA